MHIFAIRIPFSRQNFPSVFVHFSQKRFSIELTKLNIFLIKRKKDAPFIEIHTETSDKWSVIVSAYS